ncbi:MAG: hypothetical protein ABJG42_24135 [Vibrio splendidus]
MAKNVGMSMNDQGVKAKLFRIGEKVENGSLRVMRKNADEVLKLAKMNVPVEDFHVEDSIVLTEERSGQNRRIEITIGVDAAILRRVSDQEFDYSVWLHEGQYNLGELSELKNEISRSDDPRARVGNKYLERAIDAVRNSAIREIKKEVKKDIR